MIQSTLARKQVSENTTRKAADSLMFLRVQARSPSASCRRELRTIAAANRIQVAKYAAARARKNGVESLVQFRQEDLFKADFREATVVTLYLLPDLNLKLRPRLLADLKPGTRIVSHQFDMGDWKPVKKLESNGRTVYFWVVPERKQQRPA